MTLATQKALKPLRKLRKQLRDFPSDPRPEEVHKLRTQTRRLEATVKALTIDRKKVDRLLKLIRPVRRAAGKVRDMDVLIEKVLSLHEDRPAEGLIRLVEYLAAKRLKSLRKLQQIVAGQSKDTLRHLKRYEQALKRAKGDGIHEIDETPAPTQILAAELGHWPRLNAQNLHLFRIRVKELHYMLEMRTSTRGLHMAALALVKDTAGEWHDWVELMKMAQASLDAKSDASVLKDIAAVERQKYSVALATANALRRQGLRPICEN